MTDNTSLKQAARKRSKETGEPYVLARRNIIEESRQNSDLMPSQESERLRLHALDAHTALPSISEPKDIETQVLDRYSNLHTDGMTISLIAGSGGVGKSTTAICLAGTIAQASALAGNPKKIVVVDLDTTSGKIGSLLGQYMPTAVSVRVMPIWDAPTVLNHLVHDSSLGIDALLAPVRPKNASDVGPDFYRQIIQVLQTTHDIVILDCSSSYQDPLANMALDLSDEILFVTTPVAPSVEGMARSLTELFMDPAQGGLGIRREKVGIVVNMSTKNVGMGRDRILRAGLGAPIVGIIPADHDAVIAATNQSKLSDLLVHPNLSRAYLELAKSCLPREAGFKNTQVRILSQAEDMERFFV